MLVVGSVIAGVLSVGKLEEMVLPGSEKSERELTPKEDRVGKLIELKEEIVGSGTSFEVRREVNPLARSLVMTPPGEIVVGIVRLGSVRLTEIVGTDTPTDGVVDSIGPVVTIPDTSEGNERLVGITPEDSEPPGSETSMVGEKVGISEPRPDVPSDVTPGKPERPDVGTSSEVGDGKKSDTLKVPVVKIVTVNGGGT